MCDGCSWRAIEKWCHCLCWYATMLDVNTHKRICGRRYCHYMGSKITWQQTYSLHGSGHSCRVSIAINKNQKGTNSLCNSQPENYVRIKFPKTLVGLPMFYNPQRLLKDTSLSRVYHGTLTYFNNCVCVCVTCLWKRWVVLVIYFSW